MKYIISTDKAALESWQAKCDEALGFPESLENLHHVGAGPHAPLELGRAMHFAEIMTDETGNRFALPLPEKCEAPADCEIVDALPDDWWPSLAMD